MQLDMERTDCPDEMPRRTSKRRRKNDPPVATKSCTPDAAELPGPSKAPAVGRSPTTRATGASGSAQASPSSPGSGASSSEVVPEGGHTEKKFYKCGDKSFGVRSVQYFRKRQMEGLLRKMHREIGNHLRRETPPSLGESEVSCIRNIIVILFPKSYLL